MQIGGTNNAAVAGINLTSAELGQIVTTATGTITIGDSNQTGDITLATATLATTAGASSVVVQSSTGAGQVILDDNSGAATALNANTGSVSIAAGTGGLVEAATNTTGTADIDGSASSVSLTSAGAIGSSSKALQLQSTSLTTNTSVNSSNQYLTALSPVTVSSFNAGAGAINLQGGVFTFAQQDLDRRCERHGRFRSHFPRSTRRSPSPAQTDNGAIDLGNGAVHPSLLFVDQCRQAQLRHRGPGSLAFGANSGNQISVGSGDTLTIAADLRGCGRTKRQAANRQQRDRD